MIPVLYQSPVQFIENRTEGLHSYLLELNELCGVTTLLSEMLFKNKYDGISKDVLDNAANRGTAIHEAVQAYEQGREYDIPLDLLEHEAIAKKAARAWASYRSNEGKKYSDLITAYVEYLVSNEKDLATKIDLTLYNGKWWLGDIKTTSKLDRDYLSWQLSVETYLFERQTHEKVDGLFAMWYDRKSDSWLWIEVERKSDEEIEKLISDWRDKRAGIETLPVEEVEKGELPAPLDKLGRAIAERERQINALKKEEEEFRAKLLELMKEYNQRQVKTDYCTISYVSASTSRTFDKDKAIARYPDLNSDEYYKTTNKKESLQIKLK